MSITVRIPTILRPYTGDKSSVDVAKTGTLNEVLSELEVLAPGIGARVLDDAGALRRFVNVYVGEEDVRFLNGLDTKVADGATVSIIPAVAGGSGQGNDDSDGLLSSLKRMFARAEDSHTFVTDNGDLAKINDLIGSATFDSESTSGASAMAYDFVTNQFKPAPEGPVNKRARHTISVLSGKGGVGKTTSLLGLAGAAAAQGMKVLLIDLDPQGSLSTAALDDPEAQTSLDAFNGKTLEDLAVPVTWKEFKGLVDIVPANRSLAKVDNPADPKTSEVTLTKQLGDLSKYKLVLIDAPATLGGLTLEAVALASTVVVVAEPTLFSLRSASDAVDFALATRRAKKGWTRKVHVVLNKLDGSTESTFRVREIRRILPNVVLKSSISHNAAINEANAHGLPVAAFGGVKAIKASAEFDALLAELTAR